MNDNQKIAEWLGWKTNSYGYFNPPDLHPMMNALHNYEVPNYKTSNADAISLLPVLVERGWNVCLRNVDIPERTKWEFGAYKEDSEYLEIESLQLKPTIAQAISSAVLELIEKEKV